MWIFIDHFILCKQSARSTHRSRRECVISTPRNQSVIGTHVRCTFYTGADMSRISQKTHNICITFVQCWTNGEDVGPTLYKCYKNVLCLLDILHSELDGHIWRVTVTCSYLGLKNRLFHFEKGKIRPLNHKGMTDKIKALREQVCKYLRRCRRRIYSTLYTVQKIRKQS